MWNWDQVQAILNKRGLEYFSDGESEYFNNKVLMQYTGLNDRAGKEIYEGDVVYIAGYGDYTAEFPFVELYEAYSENDIGAVIGNIYENPELLI
jgi:uncharacterized phage protein (TIGR01671 family)